MNSSPLPPVYDSDVASYSCKLFVAVCISNEQKHTMLWQQKWSSWEKFTLGAKIAQPEQSKWLLSLNNFGSQNKQLLQENKFTLFNTNTVSLALQNIAYLQNILLSWDTIIIIV